MDLATNITASLADIGASVRSCETSIQFNETDEGAWCLMFLRGSKNRTADNPGYYPVLIFPHCFDAFVVTIASQTLDLDDFAKFGLILATPEARALGQILQDPPLVSSAMRAQGPFYLLPVSMELPHIACWHHYTSELGKNVRRKEWRVPRIPNNAAYSMIVTLDAVRDILFAMYNYFDIQCWECMVADSWPRTSR